MSSKSKEISTEKTSLQQGDDTQGAPVANTDSSSVYLQNTVTQAKLLYVETQGQSIRQNTGTQNTETESNAQPTSVESSANSPSGGNKQYGNPQIYTGKEGNMEPSQVTEYSQDSTEKALTTTQAPTTMYTTQPTTSLYTQEKTVNASEANAGYPPVAVKDNQTSASENSEKQLSSYETSASTSSNSSTESTGSYTESLRTTPSTTSTAATQSQTSTYSQNANETYQTTQPPVYPERNTSKVDNTSYPDYSAYTTKEPYVVTLSTASSYTENQTKSSAGQMNNSNSSLSNVTELFDGTNAKSQYNSYGTAISPQRSAYETGTYSKSSEYGTTTTLQNSGYKNRCIFTV